MSDLPPLSISFDGLYAYAGGQRWDLLGVADAEQHLFVSPPHGGTVERIYWIQFEEFLPGNAHTYDYPRERTVDIAGLEFLHDTRAYTNFELANRKPGSDGAYARTLLAAQGFRLPGPAMRTRMIHLPTADRRSELMIIYVRAVDASPTEGGGQLDEEAPDAARSVLTEALNGMRVERPPSSSWKRQVLRTRGPTGLDRATLTRGGTCVKGFLRGPGRPLH